MKIKLLLVCKLREKDNEYTYGSSFASSLKKIVGKVTLFNNKQLYIPGFSTNNADNLPGWAKRINNYFINKAFLKKVNHDKPDIIFFIKSENITTQTIKKIKKRSNARLYNFYPDNPFTCWNGNSSIHILNSLPLYDCFLIWSKQLMPILEAAGCKKTFYIPFGFDEKIFYPPIKFVEKKYDIVFVGTWDPEREYFLTYIIKNLPHNVLGIWGNEWKEKIFYTHPLRNYLMGPAIYYEELRTVFAQSKIVLNFIRKQNLDAYNMRTFECLATGSFMLTQKTNEQTVLPFHEEYNIVTFSDKEDLIKKINFYLDAENIRLQIAQRGIKLAEDYRLDNLLKNFFKKLEEK